MGIHAAFDQPDALCTYCDNIRDGLRASCNRFGQGTPTDIGEGSKEAAALDAAALREHLEALRRIEACDCTRCETCMDMPMIPQDCTDPTCQEVALSKEHCTDCVSVCDKEDCLEDCSSVCQDETCPEAHDAHASGCCSPSVCCDQASCTVPARTVVDDCFAPCLTTSSHDWSLHNPHAWAMPALISHTHANQPAFRSISSTSDSLSLSTEVALQPPEAQGPDSQVPYHCHWNACDLAFLDAGQFDQHFWVEHAKPQPLSLQTTDAGLYCAWNDCGVVPATQSALFDHVKHDHVELETHHRCRWLSIDAGGQAIPCGLCLPTVEALTKHITDDHIGSRKKNYTCCWQGCERNRRPFAQRQKIIRHLVTHTGDRPFVCAECGYQCSEESVLEQHRRTHTGERPFKCTLCDKAFSASTALSVHMRTHTGYKPLQCKFPGCEKRFSESSNLAKHMRTHREDKPHACPEEGCRKAFQRPDQLKRHLNKVHRGGSRSQLQIAPEGEGDDQRAYASAACLL